MKKRNSTNYHGHFDLYVDIFNKNDSSIEVFMLNLFVFNEI